ncbi:LysR family transcriptional regulator [Hydrogenoanaerobacterium saccharovorans]|uniref:LysR family transcriptional regulator n=1 Tax=Hydrogenoanaerobacterium saccharovorans TaxID=474960 RepID=A0ABS2GLT7_9FIRM|nr:LysR family transcriptional regulator [Hydrogenoanaerobacterium saccharovorans]MBM6923442.1 LysR family transcriptional regulator [Hydrogenoanaerobacterium saccharovorans]
MELQKLKCFVAVADKLSFTRAAEELYFSVPTVTHHIKSLEEQMGVQLLFRDKHSVRLTPAGETFYPVARDILSKLDAVTRQISQERDFELLRIGCTSHAEMVMLTSVFTRFRLRYPNILPDIQIANFDQILDLFEDGQLNLAFVTDNMLLRRQEGYQFHRFCRKGGFAVLPSEHPLAARDSISFSELEKQVIIRMGNAYVPFNTGNPLTRLVQLHELSNRDIYCDDDRMMMSLAKAGYGIAVLPGYCIPEYAPLIGLTTVPIQESQQLIYGVVSHKGRLRESWRYFLHLAEEKLLRDPTSTRLDPADTPPAP